MPSPAPTPAYAAGVFCGGRGSAAALAGRRGGWCFGQGAYYFEESLAAGLPGRVQGSAAKNVLAYPRGELRLAGPPIERGLGGD